jgi:hypothetical protein
MKNLSVFSVIGLSLFSFSSLAQEPTSTPTEPVETKQPPEKDPAPPEEEEGSVSFGAEADFNAIYGWRGIALSSGPVAQPSVWASVKGVNLTGWASFTANDTDGFGTFQEFDFIADYELEAAGFAITPRIIAYLVPEASVGEIELEISHGIAGPVGAYLINSVGFAGSPGSYFGQVGIDAAHDFDFGLSLEAKAGLGVGNGIFNEFNLGLKETGLNALMAGAAATYSFLDGLLYARVHAEFSDILDSQLADISGKPLIFNGGLAIGFEM